MAKYDNLEAARAHLESALAILDGEGRSAPAYLVELALEHLKPNDNEGKIDRAEDDARPKSAVGAGRLS